MVKIGDKAPSFNCPASSGQNIKLKDFKDKSVIILYFYPKDNTPGCTVQACGFRDEIKKIERLGAIVLGVSPDNLKKHDNFISKFDLPFTLLSDEDKSVCESYGVWVEKNMYGRKYMGVARTTFIIGKDGKILKVFEKVKPKDHAAEVIEFLKSI